MSSLLEKIAEKEQAKNAEYEIQFWRPEPGEIIEGRVTEMGETITENGDAEYFQIEAKGRKFLVFVNAVLHRLLEEEDVQTGDRIAVKFLGLVQSKKSDRKYKDYILVKDNASVSEAEA